MTPLGAAPILTLLPPDLEALPGTNAGWGFTITNDADYLEVTSAQFCVAPVSFPACTTANVGVFEDFISGFNDIVVGHPGGTLPNSATQLYSLAARQGIGSFDIGVLSLAYTQDVGVIVLTYNLTDLDPADNNATYLGSGVLVANASVGVAAGVAVPEPSGALFVGALLCGMLGLSRGRRYRYWRLLTHQAIEGAR